MATGKSKEFLSSESSPKVEQAPSALKVSPPQAIPSVSTATDAVAGLAINGAKDAGTPIGTPNSRQGSPSPGSLSSRSGGRTNRSGSVTHPRPELMRTTRLLFYASKGEVDELRRLLDEGSDVNASDYDKRTGLHLAASEGQLEAVQLLLDHGANVNSIDRWGSTPLADAKHYNFPEVTALLEKWGGRAEGAVRLPESVPEWEIDPAEINLAQGRLIGKGAFGEIRKVTWRGTPVAVKMILPSLSGEPQIVKEFRDEVELLTKLRHPNIVQFMGAVTITQPLMLVTEYLSGGDLHVVMKEGALHADECIKYALDIARGMNYLHNRKPESIIHRDLKPRNLLRDEGGHLKVADFGLSKFIKPYDVHEAYRMTGETGSYRYMAPEVYKHEVYDKSVDVYSFAIIVYEMFEGKSPFYSKPADEVAWYVAYDRVRPTFKKQYPPNMKELIEECWANDSWRRPSFSKIIERLEDMERQQKLKNRKPEEGPTASVPPTSSSASRVAAQEKLKREAKKT